MRCLARSCTCSNSPEKPKLKRRRPQLCCDMRRRYKCCSYSRRFPQWKECSCERVSRRRWIADRKISDRLVLAITSSARLFEQEFGPAARRYSEATMALIPIYCPNESCEHLGFVSVETLPRALTCSSCGLQSLHVPPPVSAKKNCKFAISEWRSHQSTRREREQCSYVAA